MRNLYFIPGMLSVGMALILLGCGNNAQKEQLLLGKWSLEKAFRDERQTELLKQLFFEFQEDGKIMTNISGKVEQGKYQLSGDVIHQTESSLDLDFNLMELTDSTLVLQTAIREIPFDLYFVKTSGALNK